QEPLQARSRPGGSARRTRRRAASRYRRIRRGPRHPAGVPRRGDPRHREVGMTKSVLALGAVAGEKSGDLLAAGVLAALADARCGLDARGIGGPSMAAAGFDRWWDIEALSVNGYAEVLREYPRLRRMREELKRRLIDWRPEVFLGVDAPDFNLDVEKRMRAAGVPVVHFIGPSIWAWRAGRIDRIRESVDHMLLV